jgi:dihydrofolate reductase
MIRAILACDEHWGIGKDNGLPWPHNPADLKWFKEITLNGGVVMGKKTWDSLPVKPLPDRWNYLITSERPSKVFPKPHGIYGGGRVPRIITDLIAARNPDLPIWIIGGSQLVNSCLSIIDEIWLSRISGTYNCDTFLPRTAIELTFKLDNTEDINGLCIEKWTRIQ